MIALVVVFLSCGRWGDDADVVAGEGAAGDSGADCCGGPGGVPEGEPGDAGAGPLGGGLRRRAVHRCLRGPWCPGDGAGGAVAGHGASVRREPDRPAGCRDGRPCDRLEVRDRGGVDRYRLRPQRAGPLPRSVGRARPGATGVRPAGGPLPRCRPGRCRWQTAHRLHPCHLRGAGSESAGAGRGERAGRAGGAGGRGPDLAGQPDQCRRVRPPLRTEDQRLDHALVPGQTGPPGAAVRTGRLRDRAGRLRCRRPDMDS
ncbi:hypothetical protein SNOUR_41870 [Streptomyces noursei ATCC 11455]|nr:hypothetical protein SNOUR_41870 [Streptomyces noursei ATCC 11455]